MKSKLYTVIAVIMTFGLVACQANSPVPTGGTLTPTSGTIAQVFKGEAGRWLSIALPEGWVAKLTGSDATPSIVVTNDWEGYQSKDMRPQAWGILVVPLADQGTAEQVLKVATDRLKGTLADRQGEIRLEQQEGQAYAWAEYAGAPVPGEAPAHYFLAVIATEQRSVFVFTNVPSDQQESVRPQYQTIVKAITLH